MYIKCNILNILYSLNIITTNQLMLFQMPLTVNFTLKTFCTVSPIKKTIQFSKIVRLSCSLKGNIRFRFTFWKRIVQQFDLDETKLKNQHISIPEDRVRVQRLLPCEVMYFYSETDQNNKTAHYIIKTKIESRMRPNCLFLG